MEGKSIFYPKARVHLKPPMLVNTVQLANLEPHDQPAVPDYADCAISGDAGFDSGGLVQFSEKLTGKRKESTEPQLFPVYVDRKM